MENPTNSDWGMAGGIGGAGTSASGIGGTGSDIGGTNTSGFGVASATDTGLCPTCGQSRAGGGLENFLKRLGINDDMINNLKGQFQNVDVDEYLNTAREYLKDGSNKASVYAKENPGKVAAGVAALALGAGLLYAAVNRDK